MQNGDDGLNIFLFGYFVADTRIVTVYIAAHLECYFEGGSKYSVGQVNIISKRHFHTFQAGKLCASPA